VIGTVEVDEDLLLRRARGDYSTITELADTLVRERALSFRRAHAVATAVVKLAASEGVAAEAISPELVDRAAREVVGERLELNADDVSRALDPVRFVEVRTVIGGPAPEETGRAIGERRAAHARAAAAHRDRAVKVRERLHALDDLAREWGEAV
jgi:argininosuccinate lyase